MSVPKRWLTPANVISAAALFVALGGTAWALAANSVGSRELKPNSVKNEEIAKDAVGKKELKGGIVPKYVRYQSKGNYFAPAPPCLLEDPSCPPTYDSNITDAALCEKGDVVGGGFNPGPLGAAGVQEAAVIRSEPISGEEGWIVTFRATILTPTNAQQPIGPGVVTAICAT